MRDNQKDQEQRVADKLGAHRGRVRPSRALLSKILHDIPEERHPAPLWWFKIAVPALSALLLVGGIFFALQNGQPAQQPEQQEAQPSFASPPAQPLSLAAIEAEERAIEKQTTFEEFFEQEMQLQEVDTALADF